MLTSFFYSRNIKEYYGMKFRKSNLEDVASIMYIIDKAKTSLKDSGIDQWQNGYPNEEVIKEDILRGESYVATLQDVVVGTVAITFGIEHHYDDIREGEWLTNDGEYGVIHRIAVDDDYKGKGIAGFLIDQAKVIGEGRIHSLRIDTHERNLPMQRAIMKAGFSYCGKVTIQDGGERLTFENDLTNKTY